MNKCFPWSPINALLFAEDAERVESSDDLTDDNIRQPTNAPQVQESGTSTDKEAILASTLSYKQNREPPSNNATKEERVVSDRRGKSIYCIEKI